MDGNQEVKEDLVQMQDMTTTMAVTETAKDPLAEKKEVFQDTTQDLHQDLADGKRRHKAEI